MPFNDELRDREIEILRLVVTGASNKEIASQLQISTNTVKVHLRNIFAKIGVNSRTEAAMYAVNHNLVSDAVATIPDLDQQSRIQSNAGSFDNPENSSLMGSETVHNRQNSVVWILAGIVVFLLLIVSAGIAWSLGNINNERIPPSHVPSQVIENQWSVLPSLTLSRYGFALVGYEEKIFAIGGMTSNGLTNEVEFYDPFSNRWKTGKSKPLPVKDIQGAVIAGKIYVPGGLTASDGVSDQLEIYDPGMDEWSIGVPLPEGRSAYALVAFDGDLYLFGGWDGSRVVDTVLRFDPLRMSWTTMPAMPTARQYLGAAVSGRRIFVMGGEDDDGALRSNEIFSPDLLTTQQALWQIGAPLPEPIFGMGVTSVADTIYLLGGIGGTTLQYPVIAFDQIQGWRNLQFMPNDLHAFQGFTSSGRYIYAAGGLVDNEPTSDFFRYQAVFTISLPIIVQ